MSSTLDTRVSELEKRIAKVEESLAEVPQTNNLWRKTIASARQEVAAKLGVMDTRLEGVIGDIGELRCDVARRLAEQDERLDTMELHIEGFGARFEGMGIRFDLLDRRLGVLDRIQGDVANMKQALQQFLDRG